MHSHPLKNSKNLHEIKDTHHMWTSPAPNTCWTKPWRQRRNVKEFIAHPNRYCLWKLIAWLSWHGLWYVWLPYIISLSMQTNYRRELVWDVRTPFQLITVILSLNLCSEIRNRRLSWWTEIGQCHTKNMFYY